MNQGQSSQHITRLTRDTLALILAGVVCISRTPVRTTKPSRAPEPPVPIIP